MKLSDVVSGMVMPSLSVLNAARKFNTVAVLMYHNVTDYAEPSYRSIRVKDFRRQMYYLKKKCEVISMGDLVRIYKSGQALPKTNKPRVVITLDDGFRDNYINAFPVLKEFGLPAAFFVVSKLIHWGDNSDGVQRNHLSLEEMKDMRNHGMTFCSHTHSHPNLSNLGYEDQKREIQKGMDELYGRFADPEVLQAFAYPFGEYNQFTLDILKEMKFQVGLTVWHHLNGTFENSLRLKRMTADGRDSLLKFAGQLNPYVFKMYQWHLNRMPKASLQQKHSLQDANSFVFEI